jgi:hypothetical protein
MQAEWTVPAACWTQEAEHHDAAAGWGGWCASYFSIFLLC